MRLSVLAVGHMRNTPEAPLYDTYAKRIAQTGRRVSLDGLHLSEIKEQANANAKLLAHLDTHKDALLVALDETGEDMSSRALAQKIADWRDDGTREVTFILGAADGLNDAIRQKATVTLSLGRMTWPHMLARLLLAEQIYRSISILSGHPYHRD